MASGDAGNISGLVSQFENAFVISLSLTLVTTSSAPPGTILQLLLLGFGGLALSLTSTILSQRTNANTIFSRLLQHTFSLSSRLATTIVSTYVGNYSSALLQQADNPVTSIALVFLAITVVFAVQDVLLRPG